MRLTLRLSAVAAAVSIAATLPAAADDPVRLRLQTAYPVGLPLIGETAVMATDRLRFLSDGNIDIRLYEPGQLVPPLEIFDAISSGNLDAGFSAPAFNVGKNSALALFTAMPFGPEGPEFMAWLYHGGGLELWRELYAQFDVVTVPCGIIPPEAGGWFRTEIETVADLQGLRLRWAGLGAEVVERLGASTTLTAVGDIIPSLDRGLIDGAEVGNPSVDRAVGMHRAPTRYYYFPGWHQMAAPTEMLFSRAAWDGMSERQQELVEAVCKEMAVHALSAGYAQQAEALTYFVEQGVQIREWSPELMTAFRETSEAVMQEASSANEDFRRVYRSILDFRETFSIWADVAFIRD